MLNQMAKRVCARYPGSPDRDDLKQVAALALLPLDQDSSAALVAVVAWRAMIGATRNKSVRAVHSETEAMSPAKGLKELEATVERYLDGKQLKVIQLRYFEDLCQAAAAARMNISRHKAHRLEVAALARLRTVLAA